MATNQYPQLGGLPTYVAPVQQSGFAGYNPVAGGSGNYAALAAAADRDRKMSMQRAAERQNAVIGGYDQQMVNSRLMGQQGYDRLDANYAPITADAMATRERNLARVDQYGNSQRSDLAIQNRQNLAKASQSAIMRGLGNTTIQDSMIRGQNFDNTRQMMSLEDQLLQNRISTDSNLSKTYQDTLQSRAQGLASQWNQNINNDNNLASSRLGYIGNIQDDQGYTNVANIYSQGMQQENANQQAQYDREFQAQQAALNRAAQQQQYQQPRSNGINYASLPAFGPAGYDGMTSNTFGNGGRGTFSRGR